MADCVNPLYAQWLSEMIEEPRIANGKAAFTYRRALKAIKECSIVLQHASEAEELNGIGKNICKALEDRHKQYCIDNGLPLPKKQKKRNRNVTEATESTEPPQESIEQPAKKKRTQKQYVPKHRSGAYALLMALSENRKDGEKGLTKAELQARGQPFCDANMYLAEDNTKYHTAWDSMKTLTTKEYVYQWGHPVKRYALTDEGWAAADQIRMGEGTRNSIVEVEAPNPKSMEPSAQAKSANASSVRAIKATSSLNVVSIDSDSDSNSEGDSAPHKTPLRKLIPIKDSGLSATRRDTDRLATSKPIVLQPGTFDVKLLLDNREIQAKKNRDYIAEELVKLDVDVEKRALPLGDVLWIAKLKPAYAAAFRAQNVNDDDEGSDEIVLEHIIERKRLDDLISSLKDGRFHEQKFRLKRSGMRNIIYLIETITLAAERQEFWQQSIESALAQMQVVDDIFVKQTAKTDESIKYLARMHESLQRSYEKKELHVLPSMSLDIATHHKTLKAMREKSTDSHCVTFSAFCSLCDKSDSLTLRDLYLKMLMCMRGVTGDKAVEIQKIWSTPNEFVHAYKALGDNQPAKNRMVSDKLGKEITRKQVGPTLSANIAAIWGVT